MQFTDINFALLVGITFVAYYLFGTSKMQATVLAVSSLVFYSFSAPVSLTILIALIAINYHIIHLISNQRCTCAKRYVVVGITANLFFLVAFKYSRLLSATFLPHSLADKFLLPLPVPLGISFITFHGISLVVDTFKNSGSIVPDTKNDSALNTALYFSFFPKLLSGPITRIAEFTPQISVKSLKSIDWEYCFKNLIVGYFLKSVVADNLKDQTFWIEYPAFVDMASMTLIAQMFGYSFQIFADFAGYSHIAMGLSGLFGYRLPLNFNLPYIALSFSEFWRRWHMTLSGFLRDYMYFPLGGNRKGRARTYLNLLIVMAMGGLWHGASWNFATWGIFHGLLLAGERLLKDFGIYRKLIYGYFNMLFMFCCVSAGWLLFKLPQFTHVLAYLSAITTNKFFPAYPDREAIIFIYCLPVILWHLKHLPAQARLSAFLDKYSHAYYGVMLFFILTSSGRAGDFIYFQF